MAVTFAGSDFTGTVQQISRQSGGEATVYAGKITGQRIGDRAELTAVFPGFDTQRLCFARTFLAQRHGDESDDARSDVDGRDLPASLARRKILGEEGATASVAPYWSRLT